MLDDAKLVNDDYGKKKVTGTQFVIEDKTYATSLFWQQLQRSDDPLAEVQEAAEGVLEGSDLFCIRQGKAPQFGICVSQEGYHTGDISAAITIASALSDKSSFMAVFKVSSGWWYICVRNDIVLADGDMLYVNEADAKEQFFSMLNVPDWDLKIAPKEWGIPDAEDTPIEKYIHRGAQVKLQKINAIRGTKLVLLIAALVIAGIWLISTLVDYIFSYTPENPEILPVDIEDIEEETVEEVPPEVKPWEEIINPAEVLSQCYKWSQKLVAILPPGWHIEGITCTPSSVTTSWTREIGRVLWIDKALDMSGLPFSGRSVSSTGTEVMASIPLENIAEINSPPQYNSTNLVNIINDLFQSLDQEVSLQETSYTSPQNNIYRSVLFTFSSVHDPLTWSDILMKFPGLEMNTIRYDINSQIWEYEGAIYAL